MHTYLHIQAIHTHAVCEVCIGVKMFVCVRPMCMHVHGVRVDVSLHVCIYALAYICISVCL